MDSDEKKPVVSVGEPVALGAIREQSPARLSCLSFPASSSMAENLRGSRGTILFCEDEYVILMDVTQGLREAGYAVIEAADVAEARSALNSWARIDAAVLDLRISGTDDGLNLLKWVRANRPEVAVVVATGHASDLSFDEQIPVLNKPYRVEDLTAALERVLARRRSAA
jgi:DNA-binding NtrC family response regulator